VEYANLAYRFMRGIPSPYSVGFNMMGPEELKRQRWTYVKFWLNRIDEDTRAVKAAVSK
jgi:hypothetical protein